MGRCPYLDYKDSTWFSYDNYYCKKCMKSVTELEVKYKCNPESGYEYEKCPIYKDW